VWNTETFESSELATKEQFSQPTWSPDGSQLAIGFVENGQTGLLLIDPANNNQQVLNLAMTPSLVSWSPDGQWLLFYGEQEGQSGLYIINSGNGVPYLVMDTSGGTIPYDITWIPNGQPH
jgi:Tol biopolymer transport system component